MFTITVADLVESKRLFIDGNILFQDLKDNKNVKILDANFEH